ncbi:MAG: NAD(+)/NADH kinase [Candidatus Aenigmarchaeota archaeon]|nr:NAD(+)/NADH kinase [Candidatus Aenigmarchaeota archaeon]OIN88026.1 MAG: hypothetical protein AUJ50_01860 [Candidatus Aenigmarchaeota archaeon CG1_02_38_14]PIW41458.1 MAG: hypothetical protein COW21_01775 [Candidatus Aenigmarchaeota archaeon CG15_BIG_FIL_POST_REV_8_21_14_020_37_27]PIX51147.1 MAG: hypothetical protein COZ52_00380 [Candidatus Aenigmarchaeota archaeon CG_4_8_14_3_um_filter_37_24]PIY36147.1 MAG: hypothetical protein COZ04_01195 [Candidatus Aenigmarchaeota archaeon CG_4_10_14_3_um
MKIILFSKKKVSDELKQEVEWYGFKHSENRPEIIISLGGDGTYLRSERDYPGVPKLIIRYNSICKKCEIDDLDKALKRLKDGKYKIRENPKLETKIRRRKLTCVNEFSIRNRYATTALRFYVWVNDERTDEIIADGIVVSTPFGSTGYYKSLGGKKFDKGIGVGFNNPTKRMKHLIVPENSKISIKVIRGDAVFSSDNDPKVILLEKNEIITIRKSKDAARVIDI